MTTTQPNQTQESLVIFAGAGCSVAPPSSLPGWNALNDAILETLWDRLQQHNLPQQYRDKVLAAIRGKRSENAFPPDYQAQVMVERVGIKYFELLGAVDSPTYNAVQYYTSLLAREGIVRAVVTTNFDQNFERAFEEAGIRYKSYFDEEEFSTVKIDEDQTVIPIIKIHGCCSSPQSMIDTRKQRLKGRAKALENILLELLRSYHFLFCGFSGQDFDDDKNYLKFWDAAPTASGFTYLNFPGSKIRASMQNLIDYYGSQKANAIDIDPVLYLSELLNQLAIPFEPYQPEMQNNISFRERLVGKIAALAPMDAANMLFGLIESYGDEPVARYLYDRVWAQRSSSDYEGDAFKRFLLNYGRSYVFNFQNKTERARSVEVDILGIPLLENVDSEMNEEISNPAKKNLLHVRNISPETLALIGLAQTYNANPLLFSNFPQSLYERFQLEPSKTEMADIIYYYSFYALSHGDIRGYDYLNLAIKDMEGDFDEPRQSQLLSRRAMIKLRDSNPEMIESAKQDAIRARELAEKYHEPHLLALSSLALSIYNRINKNFDEAFHHIQEAEKNYIELKRIPQYVESIVEYLKVIMLGFNNNVDAEMLLRKTLEIRDNVDRYVVEKINVFEPEYCYLMGMIFANYTDAPRDYILEWFVDAVFLAEQFNQQENLMYFRETCRQLQILDEVDHVIIKARASQP